MKRSQRASYAAKPWKNFTHQIEQQRLFCSFDRYASTNAGSKKSREERADSCASSIEQNITDIENVKKNLIKSAKKKDEKKNTKKAAEEEKRKNLEETQ